MDKPSLFGVAGKPVFHSLSPVLFSDIFGFCEKNLNYVRISGESSEEIVELLRDIPFAGLNITTPFKTEILKYIDEIDPVANEIGAVNVVTNVDGVVKGYNTDYLGVVRSLYSIGDTPDNKKCLVIGAGGAARAAAYGLKNNGGDVTLSNRNIKKGETVAENLGINFCDMGEIGNIIKNIDIVIDTLPYGIDVVDRESGKDNFVLLKADYREKDDIKSDVGKAGRILTGLDWLFFQGVASFEIFSGTKLELVKQLYKKFKNSVAKRQSAKSVFIVGFTGCGKSVVGKILAEKTGFKFVDLDREIEKKYGSTVKEIFANKGEMFFRRLENEMLKSFIHEKEIICSCGGGVATGKRNRDLLKIIPVVWIHTEFQIITDRIDPGSRPVLSGLERSGIKELYKSRTNHYAEVADLMVGNNGNVARTAERIYSEIF